MRSCIVLGYYHVSQPARNAVPIGLFTRIVASPLVEELRTRDDRFHQAAKAVAVRCQPAAHRVEGRLVRKRHAASQGVGEQLTTKVVHELLLPLLPQVAAQAVDSRSLTAVGEGRLVLDRPAAEVEGTSFANGAVRFKGQP